MHDFLKKIFGAKKAEPQITLTVDGVPGWLTERESAAKATLVAGTRGTMEEIRSGIAGLLVITSNIAGAEQDPAIHPKLKTIAKNSLPQFVRAMKVSLAKELPEDPEEFYPAAAECVKNCLHNAHGQGRYLQAIFPEEMKAVRHGIDAIGRGINALNPVLAAYRREMEEGATARGLFTEITNLRQDFKKTDDKLKRGQARIAEMEERIAAIGRERDTIPGDPRMKEVDAQKATCSELTGNRDTAARKYSALSMTASHVFRKAEKIATKQRHPAEIAVLNRAMDLLSDHEIPDPAVLDESLAAACPVAERMIEAGEVVLKNKEERTVFANTAQFRREIGESVTSLRVLEESCRLAETTLSTHPLITKMHSLEREREQLAAMLDKEQRAFSEIEEWRSKAEAHLPELTRKLQKKIGEMSGGNVQLQANDQTPS